MEQNNNEKATAETKALNVFSEMMIAKIESLSKKDGWKKPWFTEGALQWPQNINGRDYNGMNAAMLLFLCEKNGYKIPPVFRVGTPKFLRGYLPHPGTTNLHSSDCSSSIPR